MKFNTFDLFSILCFGTYAFRRCSADTNSNKGPFRTTIVWLNSNCTNPAVPFDTDLKVVFKAELYNTSTKVNLMRGNYTVYKPFPNPKFIFKGYFWKNDKWQIRYIFNKFNCNGVLISTLATIFGIKWNTNNNACVVPKGVYKFEGIDMNMVEHTTMATEREYGRMRWRSECTTKAGTFLCVEYETIVSPAK